MMEEVYVTKVDVDSSPDSKQLPEVPSSISEGKTVESSTSGQVELTTPGPSPIPDHLYYTTPPSPRLQSAHVGGNGHQGGFLPKVQPVRSNSFGISGETTALPTAVVLVGNPGVGKSAILRALGGNFESGFSIVTGLTQQVMRADVVVNNINNNNNGTSDKSSSNRLHLIDLPGIDDNPDGKVDRLSHHMQLLHDVLSDERRKYLIFFVIAPRNGRIGPSDISLMKLVLANLRKGPKVGFIFTQVENGDFMAHVKGPDFLPMVLKSIGQQASGGSTFLERKKCLVLERHSGTFSAEKVMEIQNFILSFTPKKVQFLDILGILARDYFSSLLHDKSK
jgi:hypothetical protein